MRTTASKRNFWIETAVATLLITLAAAPLVRSELKPLNADELKINVGDLRSLAAAGKQLTEAYMQGTQTETFFREQSSLLRAEVTSLRQTLDSAEPVPDVESELHQARTLAARLGGAYEHLADSKRDSAAAGNELGGLVAPLKQLEEGLKQKSQNE